MNKKFLLGLASIFLFFFLFRLGIFLSELKPLWNDELYTQSASIEKLSYAQILSGQVNEGNNSPLFYILQKAVCAVVGYTLPFVWDGDWSVSEPRGQVILRYTSNFFMSLALVILFFFFAKEFSLSTGIYALLTGLSSGMVWAYWAEARPYSLLFLLIIVEFILFYKIIRTSTLSTRLKSSWLILHILLCLTSVLGNIQSFFAGIVLVFSRDKEKSKLALFNFVPLVLGIFYYWQGPKYPFAVSQNVFYFISENVPFVSLALIFISGLFLIKRKMRSEVKNIYFLFILMLGSVLMIIAGLSLIPHATKPLFDIDSRYFIHFAAAGIFLVSLIAAQVFKLKDRKQWLTGTVVLTAILIFNGLGLRKELAALKEHFSRHSLTFDVQRQKVEQKAMLVSINHYRPALSQWKSFLLRLEKPETAFVQESARYYETIVKYLPTSGDAYQVLGVCYWFLNKKEEARQALEKTVILQPDYFWNWYDLGAIYYEAGDFRRAAECFQKALAIPPQATAQALASSRVLTEIMRSSGLSFQEIPERLQTGYRDAYVLSKLSEARFKGQPVAAEEPKILLKIF